MHREPRGEDRPAEELFEEDEDQGGWVIRWDQWPLLDFQTEEISELYLKDDFNAYPIQAHRGEQFETWKRTATKSG